jgi:hypothetical protein
VVKRNRKKEKDPFDEQKREFAEKVTPDWRLDQAVQEVSDSLNGGKLEIKQMGEVIKWVINDVIKEEQYDFRESNLTIKDVQRYISEITRDYVKAVINEASGL